MSQKVFKGNDQITEAKIHLVTIDKNFKLISETDITFPPNIVQSLPNWEYI